MNKPNGDYQWERGGLDDEHVKRYQLPLSIEGKGYQWEALTDDQAREIIETATTGLIDSDAIAAVENEEDVITKRFKSKFKKFFELES